MVRLKADTTSKITATGFAFVAAYPTSYYGPVSLAVGDEVRLQIEKPAAGGWMIARERGQVVMVSGAIPGETVVARVERSGKGVAFARVVTVAEASGDRRDPFTDPLCGGCLYAHVAYPRQLEIKGQVIADALARIGRVPLAAPVVVAASPAEGYRMRARLHVRGPRIGFFREATHDICDARSTRQLLPATCDVLDRAAAALRSLGAAGVREVEVSENIAADQRALHLEAAGPLDSGPIAALADDAGITGLTLGSRLLGGDPHVVDTLTIDGRPLALRRHVQSFFQGNRFLLAGSWPAFWSTCRRVPRSSTSMPGSACSRLPRPWRVRHTSRRWKATAPRLATSCSMPARTRAPSRQSPGPWNHSSAAAGQRVDVLIVDPPRTGLSREAVDRALALDAPDNRSTCPATSRPSPATSGG